MCLMKWALEGAFTLGINKGIFYVPHMIKFQILSSYMQIRGPKLASWRVEHIINSAQNRGLFFYNYPAKHKIPPVGPTSWDGLESCLCCWRKIFQTGTTDWPWSFEILQRRCCSSKEWLFIYNLHGQHTLRLTLSFSVLLPQTVLGDLGLQLLKEASRADIFTRQAWSQENTWGRIEGLPELSKFEPTGSLKSSRLSPAQ